MEGAEAADSTGMPAIHAFCTSSNDVRPLTCSSVPASGSRPSASAQPTTLSTALCRPTSSRTQSTSPAAVNSPAACSPPVRSKTAWASRNRSGSAASRGAGTRTASSATDQRAVVLTASRLSLPHTPHELDV